MTVQGVSGQSSAAEGAAILTPVSKALPPPLHLPRPALGFLDNTDFCPASAPATATRGAYFKK